MSLATVSSKGQITLPAKVRLQLGIRSKDKVQFFVRENEIVIKPLRSFRQLRGSVSPRKGDQRKTMRDAVARHVMETSE
jgi:AbrB family looped-hinge helix DNA binding protein